jgi:hypothetical protein
LLAEVNSGSACGERDIQPVVYKNADNFPAIANCRFSERKQFVCGKIFFAELDPIHARARRTGNTSG